MLLACTTVTSALPDMGVHEGGERELWASNDPTPSPQPRGGPVVWMGDTDEFAAVTTDGLPSPSPSPSPDFEGRWDRHELKAKNRRELGKNSCGGKGKKSVSCNPWACVNGELNGNGWDYNGNVAQTASGKTCKFWVGIKDANGNKYADDLYGLGCADKK